MRSRFFLFFSILLVGGLCFFILSMKFQRPYLTVIGFVKMGDGIGRQSAELIHALHDRVNIAFVPTRSSDLSDVPPSIRSILVKTKKKRMGKIVLYEEPLPIPNGKIHCRLNKFLKEPKNRDQIRIAYSMVESSRIPSEWADSLNTYFDAVAVPDEFLVEVYQLSGVSIPIFILPLGLEMDSFLEQPTKSVRNQPFCFINPSSMIPRKNHEGLIQAFYQAFGDNPDVQLLMNYRYESGNALERVAHLIDTLNVKNIILQNEALDNQQYLQVLLKGDVLVSLSKGEGFSIQPREAMALGLPVVISDNTAHKTIIKTGLACGIDCPIAETAYSPFLHCTCGEEYTADIEQAAGVLRDLYENYEKHLESALERKKWASCYQFENLKPLYLSLIKPTKVILGDRNQITAEALITNSPELYEKYSRLNSK